MSISLRTLFFSLDNRMTRVFKARLHANNHHYENEMITSYDAIGRSESLPF
jgi:hypothetical protein